MKDNNWEDLARKLFNPYATELKFDNRDWKVFLNRLKEIVQQAKKEERDRIIEEIKEFRDTRVSIDKNPRWVATYIMDLISKE